MIKFSLPGYICHEIIIKYFLELQTTHPNYFIENRIIDSAYDMPAHLFWNGGRVLFNQKIPKDQLYSLIDSYRNFPLKLRHTCTNMFITKDLCYDYLCNQYISYCEHDNDSVIVYSPDFADYIRQTYPKYKIIWSTTRRDSDINQINQITQNDLLVLDYKYNHDNNILKSLQNPSNIEILCAENCVFDCPNRISHYASLSMVSLQTPHLEELQCPHSKACPSNFYQITQQKPHAISSDYVSILYDTYGIENFKISGRTNPPYLVIETILYYLIKPEFRDMIRQEALMIAYT